MNYMLQGTKTKLYQEKFRLESGKDIIATRVAKHWFPSKVIDTPCLSIFKRDLEIVSIIFWLALNSSGSWCIFSSYVIFVVPFQLNNSENAYFLFNLALDSKNELLLFICLLCLFMCLFWTMLVLEPIKILSTDL